MSGILLEILIVMQVILLVFFIGIVFYGFNVVMPWWVLWLPTLIVAAVVIIWLIIIGIAVVLHIWG